MSRGLGGAPDIAEDDGEVLGGCFGERREVNVGCRWEDLKHMGVSDGRDVSETGSQLWTTRSKLTLDEPKEAPSWFPHRLLPYALQQIQPVFSAVTYIQERGLSHR